MLKISLIWRRMMKNKLLHTSIIGFFEISEKLLEMRQVATYYSGIYWNSEKTFKSNLYLAIE